MAGRAGTAMAWGNVGVPADSAGASTGAVPIPGAVSPMVDPSCCTATTKAGKPCASKVIGSTELCIGHTRAANAAAKATQGTEAD